MTKAELRNAMRKAKAAHTVDELRAMSHNVCRAITSTPQWQAAHTVLLYHPLPDEADISPLLPQATAEGKTALLPAVEGEELVLRRYRGEASLLTGAYGIKEPTGEEYATLDNIDLALVPGMAFDNHGRRLGRGKGYYDRLLPRLRGAHRMGVCFPFQTVDSVPIAAHDQGVDSLIAGEEKPINTASCGQDT